MKRRFGMNPIYALPLAVAAIAAFVVWQRDLQRKPTAAEVRQIQEQVATQQVDLMAWQAKPSLLPIQEAWRVATQAVADCGGEWGIMTTDAAAGYTGPSLAWHGFLKATTPDHAAMCAVYLSEQVDATFGRVISNHNGTVISFSVLGIAS